MESKNVCLNIFGGVSILAGTAAQFFRIFGRNETADVIEKVNESIPAVGDAVCNIIGIAGTLLGGVFFKLSKSPLFK